MKASHMNLDAVTDARNPAPLPGVIRKPHLKALTSVRFFAALYVALDHLVRPFSQWGPFASFFGAGYTAVSFFFILSGFILTYSHAQEYERHKPPAGQFWIARFARIYPVYLVVMLLSGALYFRVFAENKLHALAFAADLLCLQAWSVRMVNFFNVPAWSLSAEAFFYLIFPLVLLRLRPATHFRALCTLTAFYLCALAAPVAALYFYPAKVWSEYAPPGTPGGYLVFTIARMPLLMLPQFLAGISLGWLYLRFPPKARTANLLTALGLAGLGAGLFFASHFPFLLLHNGLFLPFDAMLLLGLCQTNWLTRALSNAPLLLLGEASFAFYLIHFNLNVLTQYFYNINTVGAALLKLALIIPLSVLLHLAIERPGRRAIMNWWKRRHPPDSASLPRANPAGLSSATSP